MTGSNPENPVQSKPGRKIGRALLAGIVGIFASFAVSAPLLFAIGPFTIFNEAIQSPKVIAVWGELEPLPLLVSNPVGFGLILTLLGAVHGLVFAIIAGGLPASMLKRGLLYGLIIWLLASLFFELQAPFAMLGEPLLLVLVELAIQFAGALMEGVTISWIYGKIPS